MTPQEAAYSLFHASRTGNVSDAEAALAAGADVNARNELQRTSLHWAAQKGHTGMVHQLIEQGAEVNARDESEGMPLHLAAENSHTDIVRLLIEQGAEVNARDKWQRTPLHWSARNGHTDIVRLLIEKGADVNTRDKWQRTPLNGAAELRHTDTAELLDRAERWDSFVTGLKDTDKKLDVTKLVDEKGQPTVALNYLLPNDLFGQLGRPDFYLQGMDGLVQVFPYLPQAIQNGIDLTTWRRAKVQEANRESGAVERYCRRSSQRPRSPDAPER